VIASDKRCQKCVFIKDPPKGCICIAHPDKCFIKILLTKANKVKARLDCERIECIQYGGLGCHGADDPLNQTCCRLDLNKATKCLDSKPKYIHYEAKS